MNQTIATGHVMRCLAIADELSENNIVCVFVIADDNAKEIIRSKGYECIVLDSIWNDLDSEIDAISELIEDRGIKRLLIDTYQVTDAYLRALYKITYTIYIDDLNQFIYPVHSLVCYANYWKKFLFEKRYRKAVEDGVIDIMPQMYLGCDYVPLRREFRGEDIKGISEDVNEILVMSGGADPFHAIKKILCNISLNKYSTINVICGKYNTDYNELIQVYGVRENVHLYRAVDNLIDFMKSADLAISAGETTLYELCAVGTPTITYSIADNQIDNVKQFDEDKLMAYAGDLRGEEEIDFEAIIQRYSNVERRKMSLDMQKLVSVKGKWNEIVSN